MKALLFAAALATAVVTLIAINQYDRGYEKGTDRDTKTA